MFAFTGKQIIAYDKCMHELNKIDGLQYAYCGLLSPDETKLLVVSSSKHFYVISTTDFASEKRVIRGKNYANLECRGCWSFDGSGIFIPVYNEKQEQSELRVYKADDFSYSCIDFKKYHILYIYQETTLKKYLIIGQNWDYPEHLHPLDDMSLMWYDGQIFDTHPIRGFEDALLSVDLLENKHEIYLHGSESSVVCNYSGKNISDSINYDIQGVSFEKIFEKFNKREDVRHLAEDFRLNRISAKEYIHVIEYSCDKKYCYIGTSMRLLVINTQTGEQISLDIEYGVQKILELDDGRILISTWSGIKSFIVQ